MSEASGALGSGPESRFVVDALSSLLDGDAATGRRHLLDGAATAGWAAVLHRLDVAGRALALDAGILAEDSSACTSQVAALAAASGIDRLPAGIDEVLAAWARGDGVPVAVDLQAQSVDRLPEDARALGACLALAWLVDRSGFPPQVVA